MAFLEVLIFISMLGILVSSFFVSNKKTTLGMYIGLVLLIGLQFIVGPYRFQMVPIYLFALIYIIVRLIKLKLNREPNDLKKSTFKKVITSSLLYGAFIIAFAIPALMPIKDFPKPEGEYAIGVRELRFIDSTREEMFTEDLTDLRNLSVTVWYPAENVEDYTLKTYWDEEGQIEQAVADLSGNFLFNFPTVITNSYIDAPISSVKDSYPVLIYSHSNFGINTENTILYESLASNGFIVFSINHTYESMGSLFPDGEFIAIDASYLSELYDSNKEDFDALFAEFEDSTTTIEEKHLLIDELLTGNDLLTQMVTIRTADSRFLLDELEIMNANTSDIFYSKLNLEEIGMFGWSLGGATSEETCLTDTRVKACINMDGYPFGEVFNSSEDLSQPFMYITSGQPDDVTVLVNDLVFGKLSNDAYLITIEGAVHTNFMDLPYFFEAYKHLGLWGSIDAEKMNKIKGDLVLNFFDKYLNDKDVDIESVSDQYDETTIKAKYAE